jgi:hypothetical protein
MTRIVMIGHLEKGGTTHEHEAQKLLSLCLYVLASALRPSRDCMLKPHRRPIPSS